MRPCENPFRAQRINALPFQPQGMDWPTLMQRLAKLNRRAAIVGPEGSGKTTLLRELGNRLAAEDYRIRWMQLGRDRRSFPRETARRLTDALGPRDVILFDGAGHLSPPRWWAFKWRAKRAGGLIITGHRGRRLPLLLRTRTDPRLLADLAGQLTAETGRVSPPIDAAQICRRHRGNIREALRELYDRCAAEP